MAITLIDFYADWCGPCKLMKPVVSAMKSNLKELTIQEIDVEAEPQLAAQYGVMSIPTFVILKDNKEVDRKLGAMPEQLMVDWVKGHLAQA